MAEECRHEFVWVVWTRPGKKQDNAEDDPTSEGRREYTWNVDEMTPFAKFGKKYDKNCDISDACCTDAGHDMPVNKERRHEFVWVV